MNINKSYTDQVEIDLVEYIIGLHHMAHISRMVKDKTGKFSR